MKKILYQSDFVLAKTGFGRASKSLLTYLYKTGKYEIVHYCCGLNWSNPILQKTPWVSVGVLPDNKQEIEGIKSKGPEALKLANYGAYNVDKAVHEFKPDVIIGNQDIWGISFLKDKPYFRKIPTIFWTTLDSIPIFPPAVEAAKVCDNFWVWSPFAEKELKKMGHDHVQTIPGPIDSEPFRPLGKQEKNNLRLKYNIEENAFITGFVFRNQLRKSVGKLIEGYKLWKNKNPNVPSYLLLHTNFSEPTGWNIHRFCEQFGVNKAEILCTYVCKNCNDYEIKSFVGEDQNCRFCGAEKSQITCNSKFGVSEDKLNEIYNLMDFYCHPFTSGGLEVPIVEAKLAGLITAVTNYSCGEDHCVQEAYSIPLDYAEYTEHGSQFIKASTYPESIESALEKVFKMDFVTREHLGDIARKWAYEHFSIESLGPKIESILDSLPDATYDFTKQSLIKDPNSPSPNFLDTAKWVKGLYKYILKTDIEENDKGFIYWMNQLQKNPNSRPEVEKFFRQTALNDNNKLNPPTFEDWLGDEGPDNRILFVIPESIGDIFLCTSLLKDAKEKYPDCNVYVAVKKEYSEVLKGNPYIFKIIEYTPQMDNLLWLEGYGNHKGYFKMALLPYFGTQRQFTYQHNREILNL